MDVLYPNCAGLDVHKDTAVACARRVTGAKVTREVRTFKTTTGGLFALSEWLSSQSITHIAMEATGIYWKPVWNILSDGDFVLMLANAAHVKNVPGRKTDVNDATWLADLLAHGLIRASFVPDSQTQEQRGLLRTRKQLTRERTSHVQRLQKTLEEANIKLDSVISDVIDASGRAMIEALIAGETDPLRLAGLAGSRIKASPAMLSEALRGRNATSPLSLAAASSASRCAGPGYRRDRQGGRGQPRTLSRVDPGSDQHARYWRTGGSYPSCRDRNRYEPVSDSGPSDLLGGTVP